MTTKAPEPSPAIRNIYDAMLDIYKEGKLYAQKASRNTAQSYNYTSEADFLALMRPQLAAHDIVCHPAYEVVSTGEMTTKSGTVMQTITLRGRFVFVHAPSATSVEVITIGQGTDQQDKAAYKAMTGAQKYAIRQAFMIETGDDPEKDDEPEPQPEHPKKSRFLEALSEQKTRIVNNSGAFARVLKKFDLEVGVGNEVLEQLPGETKRAIILALKEEPPF